MFFRLLSKLNKIFLPSHIHRDLTKLGKVDQAIIAWKLWVTKNALDK